MSSLLAHRLLEFCYKTVHSKAPTQILNASCVALQIVNSFQEYDSLGETFL